MGSAQEKGSYQYILDGIMASKCFLICRGQIGDISEYVQPVLDHCRYKKNQFPGVPLFIIGNSLGGLIAVLATLDTQVTLDIHVM